MPDKITCFVSEHGSEADVAAQKFHIGD